jgi:hypothetical protein
MSGKPYLIKTPNGQIVESSKWLKEKLDHFTL